MLKHFIKFLLILSFVYSAPIKAETITVAVIAPKQGEYKKEGEELFNGAKLAIDEINKKGGLNNKEIDILTIDDRCDDRLAISTAEMLALLNSKKIGLVVGPYCSNRFAEIANIYENSKIFQIVPTTVTYNQADTNKKGQIMFLGTKSQMSGDFFNFYNQNFAGLKTAFIYDDNKDDGYSDVAKSLFKEFQKYGKSNLLKFYTLNNSTNITDLISTVKKDQIAITFVLSSKDASTDFILSLKKQDEDIIVFTAKDMPDAMIYNTLKEKSNGIYVMALKGFKDSIMFTENLVDLRLRGIEPKGLEVYSYAAVKLWGDLVESNQSFDYKKLLSSSNSDALKEKWSEFMMHSGSIKSSKYIIEMYNNNSFKQVY